MAATAIACGADQSPPPAAATPVATGGSTTIAPTPSTASSADPAAATTPPPTTTPATTAPSPEAEVIAAYQAFWDTWLRANDPPNPDHPDLARWYTGPALERARAEIAKNKAQGVGLRTPPNSIGHHSVAVVEIGTDFAHVLDCAVDDGWAVDLSTGRILNDRVSTWDFAGRLVRIDDAWKVESNDATQRRDGVQPCGE